MMLVLFWDIDGTLLTTGRAGLLAWEGAAAAVLGRPVDLSTVETAGLTDVEIAVGLVQRFELDPGRPLELVRGYEARLPQSLARRVGGVLPGVRDMLERLRAEPDVHSLLLTGNTEAGGRAKLRHYGLDDYFTHGAFADGTTDRLAIARRAFETARALVGDGLVPERTWVIGDTPHDIRCARAIGARAIAVATGSYTMAQLKAHEPWWAVEQLPDPARLLARLRDVQRPT
jgi:phosphoglycolate phosphatase-like HAD superfamily hydrolase